MAKYIYRKKQILKQLGINLTREQVAHLVSLKGEIAVDNYARSLILASR